MKHKIGGALRILVSEPDITSLEADYVNEVLSAGFVSGTGPVIPRFESSFLASGKSRHAVAVSSGTAGLHLALEVLGIVSIVGGRYKIQPWAVEAAKARSGQVHPLDAALVADNTVKPDDELTGRDPAGERGPNRSQ